MDAKTVLLEHHQQKRELDLIGNQSSIHASCRWRSTTQLESSQ